MVKGKTKSGFKFEVSKRWVEDWRFTVALADMDSGDESRILSGSVTVVKMLLRDNENAFYKHLENLSSDGVIERQKVFDEVTEMLEALGKPVKKS